MTIISINKKTAEEQQYDVPRKSERNFIQSIIIFLEVTIKKQI